MANTREIKDRIRSIEDTRKITNAMYLISSTKLRKARKELEDTEPFFYDLQGMIARLIRHLPDVQSRYLASEESKFRSERQDVLSEESKFRSERQDVSNGIQERKQFCRKLFLVVTADKGLAGSYNHNVLKLAEEEITKCEQPRLLVVGEVGRAYFHAKHIEVDEHFLYTAQNPTMHRARVITSKILDYYESGEADQVVLIFTSMKNGLQTETNLVPLLPLERGHFVPDGSSFPAGADQPIDMMREEFCFLPSPEAVLDHVIPNYLTDFIYGALVESYCSEHQARMSAMQAADDSAKEMLHALSVEYNRVRQAAITQEITEVIAGAKAQKQKREKQKIRKV